MDLEEEFEEMLNLLKKLIDLQEKTIAIKTRTEKLYEELHSFREEVKLLDNLRINPLIMATIDYIKDLFDELNETMVEIKNLVKKMVPIEDMDELFEKIDIQFAKAEESLLKIKVFIEAGKEFIQLKIEPEDEDE